MDNFFDFLFSSWLTFAGSVASILGLIFTILSLIHSIQRRYSNPQRRKKEDLYLDRLLDYIQHINVQSAFDERFFIQRTLRLKESYHPRSFFVSGHLSVLSRLPLSGRISETDNKSEGYYTRNLFRVAQEVTMKAAMSGTI